MEINKIGTEEFEKALDIVISDVLINGGFEVGNIKAVNKDTNEEENLKVVVKLVKDE